jgi:hypothetical protein
MTQETLTLLLGLIGGILGVLIGALKRWIAEEYAASTEINRPLLVRKARYAGIANIALLIEGIVISFAAAASLYG